MASVNVTPLDLQFGDDYDQQKMNRLVDEINAVVSGVTQVASQVAAIPTNEGVTEAQLTAAIATVNAEIVALTFASLKGVDPGTFANPANGDVIKFVNGYWSAEPDGGATIPLTASNGLLGWAANAYQWYTLGAGLKFGGSILSLVPGQIDHNALANLAAGNPHPQYPLIAIAENILGAWSFAQQITASQGLVSDAETYLYGDLLQAESEPVQSIQDTDAMVGEDIWTTRAQPGMLTGAAGNADGSDAETWYSVTRTADVIDQINFQGNYLTFNGDDVLTLPYVAQNQAAVLAALGPGVVGPTGPAGLAALSIALDGDSGDDGMPIPGPAGATGAAGLAGAAALPIALDGADGEDATPIPGPIGAPGAQGIPGGVAFPFDGEQGEDGLVVPGPQGIPGLPGTAALPIALDGSDGEDGQPIPGSPGIPGTTGGQGPTGPAIFLEANDGEDGAPGNQGLAGAQGTTGAQGPTGAAVYLEAPEADEPMVFQGAQGSPGTTGAQGPTGAPVYLEAPEADEPLVFQGAQGNGGVTGAQGPAGPAIAFIDPPDDWMDNAIGPLGPAPSTAPSGTAALGTSAIASGASASVVTVSAPGMTTADVIGWGFNGDPTGATGYVPSSSGMLTIIAYPTTNNANFKVTNNTSASITPTAVTLNFRAVR